MSIKAIDLPSIHRLTSGQVVIDLQTAVKELVENSLDANATSIEVRFKNYGLTSVEVIDNGHGIGEQDHESIVLKHHTSKLSSYSDLATVQTFGFRGEALSSLCALSSSLTVVTATAEQAPMATILEFSQDGKLKGSRAKTARNKGTTTIVSGLFTPLPVRRKEFERNAKREFAKALSILHAYALVPCTKENNGVRLVVTNQQDKGSRSIQLQTDGTSSLRASVLGLWGPKSLDNVVPLNLAFNVTATRSTTLVKRGLEKEISIPVEVRGLISELSSGCGRANTDRQFLFVNGRPCSLNKIQKVLNEIYRSFNSGQAPFLIADFHLPTEAYDVNVSPDKRTIFLHNEDALIQALKESVEDSFSSSRSTYSINHAFPPSISRAKPSDSSPVSNRPSSSSNTRKTFDEPEALEGSLGDDDSMVADSATKALSFFTKSMDDSVTKQRGYSAANLDIINDTPSSDKVETRTTKIGDSSSEGSNEPPKKRLKVDATMTSQSILNTKGAAWNLRGSDSITQPGASQSTSSSHIEPSMGISPSVRSNIRIDEEGLGSSGIQKTVMSRLPSLSDDFRNPRKVNMLQDDDTRQVQSVPEDAGGEPTIESGSDSDAHELEPSNLSKSKTLEVIRTLVSKATLKLNLHRLQDVWRRLRLEAHAHDNISEGMSTCLEKHAGLNNDIKEAEEELTRVIRKEDFGRMQVMGQFNLGFIIARLRRSTGGHLVDDLFIIDQHAADEKYNFESLQQSTRIKSQKLLKPQPIELTSVEELSVMDNIHVLRNNGFDIIVQGDADPGSGERIQLVSQPISKDTIFGLEDLAELIYMIRENPGSQTLRCSKARAMFAMRACRKSVMIGTPLTVKQMISIVHNMGLMNQPWHCPHGRPTMRHLANLHSFNNNAKRDILWTKFAVSD